MYESLKASTFEYVIIAICCIECFHLCECPCLYALTSHLYSRIIFVIFLFFLLFCVNLWPDDLMWSHILFEFSVFISVFIVELICACIVDRGDWRVSIDLCMYVLWRLESVCGFHPCFVQGVRGFPPFCQMSTGIGGSPPRQSREWCAHVKIPLGALQPWVLPPLQPN